MTAPLEEEPGNYRVAIDVMDEDNELNVIIGDLVINFEEYLTACTDTWWRLQRARARAMAKKSES